MTTKKKFERDWDSTVQKIKEQEKSKKGRDKDDRFYVPKLKEDGTAQAIIRFLESKDTDVPFVKIFNHYFEGPGGWLIEKCPTTVGRDCPVCKANSELWNSDQDTVRRRSRKTRYYANILVVKDPQVPENDGKVFLFEFGKKIYEKIMEKVSPKEESLDKPVMVFDYYNGADFRLNIKQVKVGNKNMPNYDSSRFSDNTSPIGDDDYIEKIHSQLNGLAEFVAPNLFKEWDELSERYEKVVGSSVPPKEGTEDSKPAASETETESSTQTEEAFDGNDDAFFDSLKEDGDKKAE